MNRRSFLTTSAASIAALAYLPAAARDVERVESPLMRLLDEIPDRPDDDGLAFPPTHAFNNSIRALAPGEVPDLYWDPYSEDLRELFGLFGSAIDFASTQDSPDLLELWKLNTEFMVPEDVIAALVENGWSIADEDLRYLQYEGSEDDRRALVSSMNMVGSTISDGSWDHIALPNDNTMVLGADPEFVRTTADRVKHHTALTPVRENFHALGEFLPIHTYEMNLLPPESLPIQDATATFVCKSYHKDGPIIHSVGVRTASDDLANALVHDVPQLIATAVSPTRDLPYSDFLKIENVYAKGPSARFDFVITEGEWDVIKAVEAGDLRMFPTLE